MSCRALRIKTCGFQIGCESDCNSQFANQGHPTMPKDAKRDPICSKNMPKCIQDDPKMIHIQNNDKY